MRSDRPILRIFILLMIAVIVPSSVLAAGSTARLDASDPVRIVRRVMETPDDKIDFARAKLTFDKIYDPKTDIDAGVRQIDAMAQTIRTMAGPSASSRLRLIMLRKYIYERGAWNGNNPFQYDLTDPLGHKPVNRLLSTYLATHRGNCVSMPMLFVALAQRLGLNATLSPAPDHVFVKYIDDVTGKTFNLEATSGAYPARDAYMRQNMPMTDAAIANGIYMKTLSKKEALVVMAGIVLEFELEHKRFREALDVSDALRPYYPNDLSVLLVPADSGLGMFREEFLGRYPTKAEIPPSAMARYKFIEEMVEGALDHAYALGWRETDGETQPSPGATAHAELRAGTLPQR